MAIEVIFFDTFSPYIVDDTDSVTLQSGSSLSSGSVGFTDDGLDQTITTIALRVDGVVGAVSNAIQFGVNVLDLVSIVRIEVGLFASVQSFSNDAIHLGSVDRVLIENAGQIRGQEAGIFISSVASTATIRNIAGATITGINNSGIFVNAIENQTLRIENSGVIETDSFIGFAAIDIRSALNLINTGTVESSFGPAGLAVTSNEFNDRVTNSGTIIGEVDLGSGNDVVANSNEIIGDVELGGSDDRYNATGAGVVTGAVNGRSGADRIFGGSQSDRLNGDDNGDLISGRDGADILQGGAGADTIYGGTGDDSITGDGEADTINGNAGVDTVQGGDGSDFVRGGSGTDTVEGGAGDDTLRGDADDDRIVGGTGRDTMYGGSGSDVFVFETLGESGLSGSEDVIGDFRSGADEIDISALAGTTFTFIGDAAFSATGGPEVRAVSGATNTLVSIDADGDGTSDSDITLAGTTAVVEGDFIL